MLKRSIKFYVDYACSRLGRIKLLDVAEMLILNRFDFFLNLRSSAWCKNKFGRDKGDDVPASISKLLRECLGVEVGPLYHLQHQVRASH